MMRSLRGVGWRNSDLLQWRVDDGVLPHVSDWTGFWPARATGESARTLNRTGSAERFLSFLPGGFGRMRN